MVERMTARDRVEELKRWQDSGAVWTVVSRTPDRLTIALLRCDGGEEVDRFESADPALREFVGDRVDSTQ
ncbi:hypothetical protein MLIT_25800 [Mycolicibacterium litorale]|uniref:Uncharacterized protein n=2 Tax=Mycolicibacterium litorale TaxID=758802 RepID=A0AAD1IM72_9MYCO|nr:hypothetical protein MLIT_25800 [Mycolicibacterium litorale]